MGVSKENYRRENVLAVQIVQLRPSRFVEVVLDLPRSPEAGRISAALWLDAEEIKR
jgi:hypothetical protein